ncbi:MAG TPA: TetR/AcrR family transcriptional regulator [Mycobacteriales bacterium]|nr:TetR/AcrR family transcriptional regulator [Mycobacteriales bacterium]
MGDAGAMRAESPDTLETRRRNEILDTASQLFGSNGLRVSLEEIAGACGIKPGSLYHHFESKEAILVELVQRYHADLDRVADRFVLDPRPASVEDAEIQITGLAHAIAACAASHAAALHFSFYDPPAGASQELMRLANREPAAIRAAMLDALRAGETAGLVRTGLDLAVVSDRFCQTMLHVGLNLFHSSSTAKVAETLSQMLLHGIAIATPRNADLDKSNAFLAVKDVVKTWTRTEVADPSDRAAWLRHVARTEFGRRGYEVTTVRDIAAAAGLGTGSVYRVIGSKEELLTSIMREFAEKAAAGWTAALGSDSTTIEKLDAVCWMQINVMERFYDEFRIQLAWLRQVPPEIPSLGWSFPLVLKALRAELAQGVSAGELSVERPSSDLAARCVLDMTWMPENIVRELGPRGALQQARDTFLRGIAKR